MAGYTVESSAELVLDLKDKPIRVLHVDDEHGLLKVAKDFLEMEGQFQVETAESVKEAMEKIKEERYDVIVSDYQMPGKDGLQFLKELKEKGVNIPFIIFTGKGDEEVAIKALNLGVDQYLKKTGDPEKVYSELAHAISVSVKKKRDEEERKRGFIEAHIKELRCVLDMSRILWTSNILLDEILQGIVNLLPLAFRYPDIACARVIFEGREFKTGNFKETHWKQQTDINVYGKRTGTLEVCYLEEKPMIEEEGILIEVIAERLGRSIEHKKIEEELKKSEERYQESERKFEALFMGNPEAAVCLGPDFHILNVNSRFEELFGYSFAEVKGKHIDEVVVPSNKIEEAKIFNEKSLKGYIYEDTVRRRKDGSLIPVSVSAAPITVEGRIAGVVAVYKDISELKNAEEKLQVMNEKLRVVGGLTRHDVRNKLSIITGNLYLAKKELTAEGKIVDRLKQMEMAVEQIVRILGFAKAYEMLGAEELTYTDVEKGVNEAVSLFPNLKGIGVINDCHGLSVLADSLLQKLFYNLIDNSLKHGQKISKIRVRYEETSGDELKLVYEDDGVGILNENKPKLFKEGYSTGRSTGYGLYLIKKIVEVYGWTIQETGEPGKGAQFTITIPRMNENGKMNYKFQDTA
jgi:PAS domain S-box-containing protein